MTLGGTVLVAEVSIPETGKIAVIADPLGAPIALFQPDMKP